jgi:hypothetical protein
MSTHASNHSSYKTTKEQHMCRKPISLQSTWVAYYICPPLLCCSVKLWRCMGSLIHHVN